MKFRIFFIILLALTQTVKTQNLYNRKTSPGYEMRISNYVDSLKVIDTHEHLYNPDELKGSYLLDFTLLFLENSFADLVSAGMPDSAFVQLYNNTTPRKEKWKVVEPYWKKSFNTNYNRIILLSIKNLYGINDLNESTVDSLSARIRRAYNGDWFNKVLRDSCKIDYVIQESDYAGDNRDYVRYTEKFSKWLNIRSKFTIDSIAVSQLDPIFTLDDFTGSMNRAFEEAASRGMVAVKVNVAYKRTLNFENVQKENAKKVFNKIVNGNEGFSLSLNDAKPLQDYLLFQLLDLARKQKLPVAFHTGMQAGNGNIISNSDPTLLINLFKEYPDINFVLYHGSYPFGGALSVLAKTYPNVFLDLNWAYAISPSYAERNLSEWLETVPASKIIGFGGDQRNIENTYGQLIIARKIISEVLTEKISNGQLSESEAETVARMILHENAMKFYNLK
jgi:uncharacterized protein